MKTIQLIVASTLCAVLVLPAWADNDKNKGKGRDNDNDRGQSDRVDRGTPNRVSDHDRNAIHTYYKTEFGNGNCPPGLAKKDNGCLPPGQAKREWTVGQPLPPSALAYRLPQSLLKQLATPPAGYDYVRVDDDVVLMNRDTRTVNQIIGSLRGFN